MNKVSLSSLSSVGVPTFASVPYSPDNSQNARRFFTALACDEMVPGVQIEVSEMTAPSDAKGGPAKAVSRVRYSLPQLKLATSNGSINQGTTLAMTGQSEFAQAGFTITVPALWAKVILGAVPASVGLRQQAAAICRAAALDALNGLFGDVKPSAVFPTSSWNAPLAPTSPLFRALQGANPEDVFNGSYGVAP